MNNSLDLGLNESHVTNSSDDYYTPKWVFDTLELEFDTDPAQPIGGCSWIPVKQYYTILDDGLQQNWIGRVWLNPPYSKPNDWIERFIDHGNGICLVQFSRAKWFVKLWQMADGITALPHNMKFQTPRDGEKGIFMPVALFAMGEDNVKALTKFGRVR